MVEMNPQRPDFDASIPMPADAADEARLLPRLYANASALLESRPDKPIAQDDDSWIYPA